MTERTQEWAERVGREAVASGLPAQTRLHFIDEDGDCGVCGDEFRLGWGGICWPDFRDRLTELACIAWVEDVARERWPQDDFRLKLSAIEGLGFRVETRYEMVWHPTLVEACIAAVRAMKGFNQ